MNLLKLDDKDKIKAFDMIVKAYGKDNYLNEFGKDVQEILLFLKKMNEFSH